MDTVVTAMTVMPARNSQIRSNMVIFARVFILILETSSSGLRMSVIDGIEGAAAYLRCIIFQTAQDLNICVIVLIRAYICP